MSACAEALAYCVASSTPAMLWGEPGTAKSSVMRQIAEALDVPIEVVIASIREPSDFSGLPILTNGSYVLAPPEWAKRLAAVKRAILFLDELPTAPPAVQAALLRVVLERHVGELALHDGIAIVAAGNPTEHSAGGWDLAAPLANRFWHGDWALGAKEWAEGLATGHWTAPRVPRLPEDWERRHGFVERANVAGYIRHDATKMLLVPEDEAQQGRAWASPRSWTMGARLLAAAAAGHARKEVRRLLLVGCVGEGPANEYFRWQRDLDLPDPEDLLRDPENCPVDFKSRGDRAFVVLANVVQAATREPDGDRWTRAWRVLARAARETSKDVPGAAARTLALDIPPDTPAPEEAHVFAPILQAAGILKERRRR